MSSEIEKNSVIKRKDLNQIDYFESLISKALEMKIIDIDFINHIQIQLLELLKIKIDKFNGIDNSSISSDKAKMIMDSNIYTIGVYLKKFTPDEAIEKLQKESISNIYDKGRKEIDKKLFVCKILHQKVLKNMVITQNETYNDTIIKGIKGFFKIYDPDYNARDMKITADYPLYNNLIGKLEGIEFVEKYLESLYYENEFCKTIPNVEEILQRYSKGYKNLITNIFKIMLMQKLGEILSKGKGLQTIYNSFQNKMKEEIYMEVYTAYRKIEIQNIKIKDYIETGIEEIQSEIYNNYKLNNLEKILLFN